MFPLLSRLRQCLVCVCSTAFAAKALAFALCVPQISHLPDDLKKKFKITKPEDFRWCMLGGCAEVTGWNDTAEFKDFREAWTTLGVPDIEVNSIYCLISGILHIGNITFEPDDDGNSAVVNDEELEEVGALFQADAELLETTLTFRNMQSGGRSIVVIPLKVEQAVETQEGLAKGAYSKLFDWIVDRVNVAVATDKPVKNAIGVLDIFGFEIFETNSFEQLCINLANEKLQSHFNDHIFKMELKVYEAEGLDCDGITFADNQPCLDMIEKKPSGIFPMIDEECVVPKGSDDTLLQKLQDTHRKNSFWGKAPKGTKSVFVVNHYAGGVSYSTQRFLEKNKDVLQPDISSYMAESKDPFIQNLFPPPKPKKGRAPTLGGQFRSSLQQLYDKLNSTYPHFIKCLKTNEVKQAGIFDGAYCLRQITYLGLLEVVNIRRQGFPVRRNPDDFVARYKVLDESCTTSKAICDKFKGQEQKTGAPMDMTGKWQIGKSMVFMKDEMFTELENARGRRLEKSVILLQGFLRAESARMSWVKKTESFALAQAVVLGGLARYKVTRMLAIKKCTLSLNEAMTAVDTRWPATASIETSTDLPDKKALDAAIDSTNDLEEEDGFVEMVAAKDKAKGLLTTIKKEEEVFGGLETALKNANEAEIKDAMETAKAIDFKHDKIGECEAFIAKEDKRRAAEKADEEARIEAAKNAANAEEAAAIEKERLAKLAANKDGAIKAVKDALAMDGDLAAQRKALVSAIDDCEKGGHDCDELAPAKEMKEKISKKLDAQKALSDAVDKEIIEDIEAAVAAAEGADVDAAKIDSAKKLIDKLKLEKELADAAKEGDTEKQDAIKAKAAESGIKLEKPSSKKKKKKAAGKSAKREMVEDLADVPYAQRLSEMEGVFKLTDFDNLRNQVRLQGKAGFQVLKHRLPLSKTLPFLEPGRRLQVRVPEGRVVEAADDVQRPGRCLGEGHQR